MDREEDGAVGGGSQEAAGDKTFLFPEEFSIKIRQHRAFEGFLCSGEDFLWFVTSHLFFSSQ